MNVYKEDFDWAVSEGLISKEQAEQLWQAMLSRAGDRSSSASYSSDVPTGNRSQFNAANVAYYLGALIVISAMSWFMGLAWESFGGSGIFIISCLYALFFVLAGRTLYFKRRLRVPGGLLFTMAVCMTPLAIYGLQRWTGFWLQDDPGIYQNFHSWIRGSWFLMEVGTILTSLIALRFVRFPFLVTPIAFCLWYMSMDLTSLLYGQGDFTSKQQAVVSMWFGIACIVVAYLVDLRIRRSQGDYAFWLYLSGLMAFWCSLPFIGGDTELEKFLYCLINLGLVLLSILLKRRVFIVFGALGVFWYLGYLSYSIFRDSMLFPFALTVLGILIIYAGAFYQQHRRSLEALADRMIPDAFRRLLPKER